MENQKLNDKEPSSFQSLYGTGMVGLLLSCAITSISQFIIAPANVPCCIPSYDACYLVEGLHFPSRKLLLEY